MACSSSSFCLFFFFSLNFYPFAQMYRLDMQMPNIFPPLLLPFIHLSPHPFPSFQNTHARRFERAKSIERCQRARTRRLTRCIRPNSFLSSFFFSYIPLLPTSIFLFFYVVVASQKRHGKDELLERKDQDEKK